MIEKGFKFIDLFCGIGGFHQAMSSYGGVCVFASDIDKDCRETYYNNYGIMPAGDITKVNADDIEPFDVLCAGFPCQAFSHAGHRKGFQDATRGTLFFDVIRIASYHKPKYMLLENVKNLATHDDGRTWKVIYDTIQDAGYNVSKEPIIFSPHFLGIPQNRERVFIMCVRKDIGVLPDFYFDKKDAPECNVYDILLDDSEIDNIDQYRISKEQIELINYWDELVKGVKCKFPGNLYGDFLVPNDNNIDVKSLADYKIPQLKKNIEFYNNNKVFIDNWLSKSSEVVMFKNSRKNIEWQTNRSDDESIWNHLLQFRQSGLRVKRFNYFPTLVAVVQTSIIAPRKRYAVPRECARMQSFPDTFKIHPVDKIAYKQFGNSVNVDVVKLFAGFMFGDDNIRLKYTDKNKSVPLW